MHRWEEGLARPEGVASAERPDAASTAVATAAAVGVAVVSAATGVSAEAGTAEQQLTPAFAGETAGRSASAGKDWDKVTWQGPTGRWWLGAVVAGIVR